MHGGPCLRGVKLTSRAALAALEQIAKIGPGGKDRQAPLDRMQKAMEELDRDMKTANAVDAKRMRSTSLLLKRMLLKLRM